MPKANYMIVKAPSWRNLEKLINAWMREGWTPTGGIAVSPGNNYMQAMTRA